MSELIVWSGAALAGLGGWWWLLHRTRHRLGGHAPSGEWHLGDAFFGVVLALYFIAEVFMDDGARIPITADDVRGGIFFYLSIIGLFCALVFLRGQTPQRAFGLVPARPLRVLGLGVVCIAFTYPIVQLAEQIVARFGFSASEGDELVQYLHGRISVSDTIWVVVLAAVVAPLTEELVFRGYLYGVIKQYGGRLAAMFTSALLFAAVHHNLPAMPAFTLLAIGLTIAYEITGSLWAPIAMHMIFNLVPVVIILWFPEWISKS